MAEYWNNQNSNNNSGNEVNDGGQEKPRKAPEYNFWEIGRASCRERV